MPVKASSMIAPGRIDNRRDRVAVARVGYRTRPFDNLLRGAMLAILALMLLVRLGPACEATAAAWGAGGAAAPVISAMAGCEGMPVPSPDKKRASSACATPCISLPGQATASVEPAAHADPAPWPARHQGLTGPPLAPATPPPQTA